MKTAKVSTISKERRNERVRKSENKTNSTTNRNQQQRESIMPASTKEEIEFQHEAARLMCADNMVCAPRQFLGEISKSDKQRPTHLLFEQQSKSNQKEEEEEKKDSSSNDGENKEGVDISGSLQNPICFTTRGSDVDISRLQQMVEYGYNHSYNTKDGDDSKATKTDNSCDNDPNTTPINYWDPTYACCHNVNITRPSHDGWGIGKIVLLFCDDFMTKVYELPYWRIFLPALQPILDCLDLSSTDDLQPEDKKIAKRYLVRALLASLPPGVTIPVHHDTGEWVKHTHRVHVPVLVNDPSKILFRCGPDVDQMQRIDCEPGHVFEINNQAKHAVSNCEDTDTQNSRVHLILDYVVVDNEDDDEDAPKSIPERILLDPGEELIQTRRSIDRLRDLQILQKERPIPSYIILGAQKAGTTSLYEYICQHPWVVKACRRETHCFDWRWDETLTEPEKQLEHVHKFYYTEHLLRHPSCITGDSTPSYFLDSKRVIPRLKGVFSQVQLKKQKFFIMVRDPVKRALSHYAMVTSPVGTKAQLKTRGMEWRKKSFRQVMEDEFLVLQDCGLIPYWNIEEGTCDMEMFEKFVGSPEEDHAFQLYLDTYVPINTGSYGLITRGMYALQLRPWLKAFPNLTTNTGGGKSKNASQFCILRLESMKQFGVDQTMKKVWSHLQLPYHPVEDEEAKNTRGYQPMDPHNKSYLERFFEPHNRLLVKILKEYCVVEHDANNEWENPWPY